MPNLARGGAERVCVNILAGLDREKYEPALLVFKEQAPDPGLRQELAAAGVPVFSLRKKYLVDPRNFFSIIQAVSSFQPDIIHTHLGGDIYGRLAGHLASKALIVSTEHNINQNERGLAAKLKIMTARWAKMIFMVSQAVRDDAILRYKLDPARTAVVYNGLDLAPYQKIAPRTADKKIIFGAMGRLTEQKGFTDLIAAIPLTKNKDYSVEIAGEGEAEKSLQRAIQTLGLTERVRLVGLVEAPSFLARIDAFIFPSRWEGLGLAAIEAAASGRPVIASRAGGITEVLDQEKAWLFTPGQPAELAAQIDALSAALVKDEARLRIDRAREAVLEKFSLAAMLAAYQGWYEKLLAAEK